MSTARQACGGIRTLGDLRRVIGAADGFTFALVDRFIRQADNASTATARAAQDALAQIGVTLGLREGPLAPVGPPAATDGAPAHPTATFSVCRILQVLDELYAKAEAKEPGVLAQDRAAYEAAVVASATPTGSTPGLEDTRAVRRTRTVLGLGAAALSVAALAAGVVLGRRRGSGRALDGRPFV